MRTPAMEAEEPAVDVVLGPAVVGDFLLRLRHGQCELVEVGHVAMGRMCQTAWYG